MNEFMRQLLFLPEQASTIAREIDGLHYFVISVTMLGWASVTLATVYLLTRYRRRSAKQLPHVVHPVLWIEVTAVAGLLALFVFWWALGLRQYVRLRTPPENALEIYVTAKQWMWKFAYPEGMSSISTLTVPTNRPVKLLMTSRDVLHSFYVPAFRVKQDVLPGQYVDLWFEVRTPGTYQILCAEYCGLLHSNMWGSVVALAPDDYARWRDTAGPRPDAVSQPLVQRSSLPGTAPTMAERGRLVAGSLGCLGCHTLDGRPHIGPTWQGLFGAERRFISGTTRGADEAYLTESMMDPLREIVAGYAPVMPSYQGLIDAPEVAALLELIKSLPRENAAPSPLPVWPGAGGSP